MAPRAPTGPDYAPAHPPDSRGHQLDLYLPDGAGPWPLLMACGGSAFLDDGGSYYAGELAPWFTEAGFAVAGGCTRSSSQARFPAQVHDVKAAIRWLRGHAGEHGLDPGRFAIMGDSSGGWTAAMAGLTGDRLEGSVGETGGSSRGQAGAEPSGPPGLLQTEP